MGVSSALIMVNKYLMSTDGFHYPMALSCLGMLFSSVASWFACRVRELLCMLCCSSSLPAEMQCLCMAITLCPVQAAVGPGGLLTWGPENMQCITGDVSSIGLYMGLQGMRDH